MTQRSPQWLYWVVHQMNPTAGGGAYNRSDGLQILDRPELAWVTGAELTARAMDGLGYSKSFRMPAISILARPWGRTLMARQNPGAVQNVVELDAEMKLWRSGRGAFKSEHGLRAFPSWVLDSYCHPRCVSAPTGLPLSIRLESAHSPETFALGRRDWGIKRAKGVGLPGGRLAESDEQVAVLTVADATFAPGIVRNGLVLDARIATNRRSSSYVVEESRRAREFANAYVGKVLSPIPRAGRVLPGEPVQDDAEDVSMLRQPVMFMLRSSDRRAK